MGILELKSPASCLIILSLTLQSGALARDDYKIARSLLIPGWGQISAGSYTKGTVFLATACISLGAAAYCGYKGKTSYHEYREAETPTRAERYRHQTVTYDTYRNAALVSYGVIWLLNCYDITGIQTTSSGSELALRYPRFLISPVLSILSDDEVAVGFAVRW